MGCGAMPRLPRRSTGCAEPNPCLRRHAVNGMRGCRPFRLAINSLGIRSMPIHQTPAQRQTVKRVMHEFKHGELKTARGARKVKTAKQAVAIALSEAGASKYDTPKER